MKYNRLPFLTNTYPQTGNYITTGLDSVALYGIYADVNQVDFKIPDITKVRVVPGTSFRNIVAIYKDRTDESPKYYTSELYMRDLDAAKIESNPYFIEYSFTDQTIIKYYAKEIVDLVKNFRDEELKLSVFLYRNNFLLYNNTGLSVEKPPTQNIDATSIANDSQSLIDKIQKFEVGLLNADANIKLFRGLFYGRKKRKAELIIDGEKFESSEQNWNSTSRQREEIKQKVSQRLNELKAQKAEFDKKVEEQIKSKFSFGSSQPKIKLDPTKVDTDLKQFLSDTIGARDEFDLIEIDGVYVDCVHLIRFIDWILTKPTFDDVENNGVIPAEKISVLKTSGDITKIPENEQTNPQPRIRSSEAKYFTYQIIRLSIPATLEASSMTFIDETGQPRTIQTDKYGLVGEYCVQEDSWEGSFQLYQRTLIEPCNVRQRPNRGGGERPNESRYGGNFDNFRDQSGSTRFIDFNEDNRVV